MKMQENNKTELVYLKADVEHQNLLQKQDKCDKYDYLAAVACGAIGGMVDIFFVGMPGESKLGDWTDQQVDNVVKSFAKKMGWKPNTQNTDNAKSAIGFLERKFKVNYDQRKPSDVGNVFNIAPGTHHMMSLAHSPDIVGLFFSILNQFTSTSSFIVDGQLITVKSETFELQGGNFIMKIICGIANWFGHLMSDVAGSSGAHGRGTGIVMPFYELFGFCKFGNFSTANGRKDLSQIAMDAFTNGYDFRFGLAQAIPLVITELSIRLIWGIRRRFQYKLPLKECIPTMQHADLRVMLMVGNGTLCVMDGIDAGLRAKGNYLEFFMRLNLVAWFRFTMLVIKEVCIRVGIKDALQEQIEAFKRVNQALEQYLYELEQIDIELFEKETQKYHQLVKGLKETSNYKKLNEQLLDIYEEMGLERPWKGNFDEHMSNKNGTLVFG